MKQILLVDDNRSILQSVSEIVDWEKEGFHIAGCCYNGREAIEFIQNNNVDILIMDMKMPVMGGTEVLRYLHDTESKIKSVVLSSYDEFKLVREAFVLGAEEYLLKSSIYGAELLRIVRSLAEQIDVREKYNETIRENRSFSIPGENWLEFLDKKEEFYKNLLMGKDRKGENPIPDGEGIVLYAGIKNYHESLIDGWNSDYETMRFATLFLISEVLKEKEFDSLVDYYSASPSEYVFLISDGGNRNSIINSITEALKQYLKLEFTVGISSKGKFSKKFPEQYKEAVRDFYCSESRKNDKDMSEYIKNCLNSIETCDIDEIMDVVIINDMKDDVIIRKYNKYAVIITAYAMDFGIQMNGLDDKFFREISVNEDIYEYEEWLRDVFMQIKRQTKVQKNNQIVRDMIQYIHDNYSENIQMKNAAKDINVSYSYASKLFVQTTGQTFTKYLNKYRIKKSIELMENTALRLNDIAARTGYNNVEHFSRTFKIIMGCSPVEYRRKMNKGKVLD